MLISWLVFAAVMVVVLGAYWALVLLPESREAIACALKAVGYGEVEVDARGYRMGSLHEGLFLQPAFAAAGRDRD